MRIRLRLDAPCFLRPSMLAKSVQWAVEALTMADRLIIRSGLVPPLYEAGVRYAEESEIYRGDPNYLGESFDDAWVCYQRGTADCDDLGAWRCAELQERGENAGIRVTWKPLPKVMRAVCAAAREKGMSAGQLLQALSRYGKLYHITVRRADGSIECPSAKLGMPTGNEFSRGKQIPDFGLHI
jgi:hypothetical protein